MRFASTLWRFLDIVNVLTKVTRTKKFRSLVSSTPNDSHEPTENKIDPPRSCSPKGRPKNAWDIGPRSGQSVRRFISAPDEIHAAIIVEVSQSVRANATELGARATVLWCYIRNSGLQDRREKAFHVSAEPHGQANNPRRDDSKRHHQGQKLQGKQRSL